MTRTPVNFQQKFGLFSEQWTPKVVAEMNDYQFKIVREGLHKSQFREKRRPKLLILLIENFRKWGYAEHP